MESSIFATRLNELLQQKKIKQMTKEPEIEKDDLKTKATENIQAIIDKLNKQKNRTILKLYKNVYRF